MSDTPLDRIPSFDRVSIRAVVVRDGEDPSEALAASGIVDPIALPVVFGEDQPNIGFGDGFTPNLVALLEYDQVKDDFASAPGGRPETAGSALNSEPPSQPVTTTLPAAYGMRSLAPVRRAGYARQIAGDTAASPRPPGPTYSVEAAGPRGKASSEPMSSGVDRSERRGNAP